jgi:3D (Asp-Asp-Asp) domain-containing protein
LAPALVVHVERSRPVWVQADGVTQVTRTRATTVSDVLAEAGVVLVGQDYSVPADDQPLPAAGVIGVVRVREEVLTEQELLPYETIYQPLPDVEIDNVQTVQVGQPGVLRRLTRIRYENGVEVSRATDEETLVQAAQPHIIGYGTQIVIRTLATPDGVIEYWRAYEMYATSYAAKFTGRTPGTFSYGRTASGKYVTQGIVAIDRSMMPFGTRMYVPGYGFAEAADTGGGVRGRFIDLGYDDHNYVGWHSTVMVYFLTPVPPESSIRWIIPSTIP